MTVICLYTCIMIRAVCQCPNIISILFVHRDISYYLAPATSYYFFFPVVPEENIKIFIVEEKEFIVLESSEILFGS